MSKYTEKETDLFLLIGRFYLRKNNNNYEAARKEILDSQINLIKIYGPLVVIETSRPGLLIGKRGSNIDNLLLFLKQGVSYEIDKIFIQETEDDMFNYLLPYNCMEWENDLR